MEEIERKKIYYRLLFKSLRANGDLDAYSVRNLIQFRRGESVIDALVRLGYATGPWAAVDMIAADTEPDPRPFAREIADFDPHP